MLSFRLFTLCLTTTEKGFSTSERIKFYFHSVFARNKHDFLCVCFETERLVSVWETVEVLCTAFKFTFTSSKSLKSLPWTYIVESKGTLFTSNSIWIRILKLMSTYKLQFVAGFGKDTFELLKCNSLRVIILSLLCPTYLD